MKLLAVLLFYLHIIYVLSEKIYNPSDKSENDLISSGEQMICSACENIAGYVKRHSESFERMAKFPCALFKDSNACDGGVRILVSALSVGGEKNICKMMQMCDRNEAQAQALSRIIDSFMGGLGGNSKSQPFQPLQLGISTFSADTESMKKVANKAIESLGGAISNIGSLTNEGTEHLGKTFSNIPVAGDLIKGATEVVGKTVQQFTEKLDNFLGNINGMLFGSIGRSPIHIRKQLLESRRVRRSSPEDVEELKDYITNIDTIADDPESSQVEKLFSAFATNIKFQLLGLLEEEEEEAAEQEGSSDDTTEFTNIHEEEEGYSEIPEDPEENDSESVAEAEESEQEVSDVPSYHPKNPSKTQNSN